MFERSGRDPKRLIGARYVIEDSTPLGWVSLNKRDFIEWACSYLRDMALALTTMVSSPIPVYFAFYALLRKEFSAGRTDLRQTDACERVWPRSRHTSTYEACFGVDVDINKLQPSCYVLTA